MKRQIKFTLAAAILAALALPLSAHASGNGPFVEGSAGPAKVYIGLAAPVPAPAARPRPACIPCSNFIYQIGTPQMTAHGSTTAQWKFTWCNNGNPAVNAYLAFNSGTVIKQIGATVFVDQCQYQYFNFSGLTPHINYITYLCDAIGDCSSHGGWTQ